MKARTEKEDESSEGIRVLVYGTLKEGHGNHAAYFKDNDSARLLGRCYITGPYIMRDLGFFPCVSQDAALPDSNIIGEVYKIDSHTLDALDCLEGHPNWYKREQIDTPWKKAWMYFMPPRDESYFNEGIIENGCWNATEDELEWMKGIK